MIAPIDGSDPPERPPTPANFDARNRSIQAKSSRGWCVGHAPGQAPGVWFGGATVTIMGVRQRQDHGHEGNAPRPWMECAMAMNGIGTWPWTGAMDGGQSWWRTPNLAPVLGLLGVRPSGPRPLGCMPRAHLESVDRCRV